MTYCPLVTCVKKETMNTAINLVTSGYTSVKAMLYAINSMSIEYIDLFSKFAEKTYNDYLLYAVKKCNYVAAKILVKNGHVSYSALNFSMRLGRIEFVKILTETGDYPDALDLAIMQRQDDIIVHLISKGFTSRDLPCYILDNNHYLLARRIIDVYRSSNLNNGLDYALMSFAISKNKPKFVTIFAREQFGLDWDALVLAGGNSQLFAILANYKL